MPMYHDESLLLDHIVLRTAATETPTKVLYQRPRMVMNETVAIVPSITSTSSLENNSSSTSLKTSPSTAVCVDGMTCSNTDPDPVHMLLSTEGYANCTTTTTATDDDDDASEEGSTTREAFENFVRVSVCSEEGGEAEEDKKEEHNEDQDIEKQTVSEQGKAEPVVVVQKVQQEQQSPALPIRRRSILKMVATEDIPVSEKRCAWKSLPKPDLQKIRSESMPEPRSSRDNIINNKTHSVVRRCRSAVTFDQVLIRSYDQCIGDNPSVSYGPPISLDWNYVEMESISLDEYEENRGPRRKPRQMMLNYYNRTNILTWRCGATEQELKVAEQEANKTKKGRAITKYFLPAMKLEDAVRSAARKTKRLTHRKKDSESA
jgi:hypothetical protein